MRLVSIFLAKCYKKPSAELYRLMGSSGRSVNFYNDVKNLLRVLKWGLRIDNMALII